ncbi:M20 family metallopeptidase [Roseomonas sp. AR75]|uniref:M20 family metallopeptidase n=1 Tax=Roseomonas sp. AR75 TaxID=2562311 RepID=UPI0010C115A2|nr:M20 family metallopeptidase [Roseomonas sp. AR75]
MQNEEEIWRLVDAKRSAFNGLADRVWAMPELCYDEHRSAAEHKAMLEREGFRVTDKLAGIPTAMMGEAGEGGPVIAILGEYDALPGLSQEAGVAEPKPVPGEFRGHGCGHNLLGAGAMLAATAVKDFLAANGLVGRVRYYGCPAEEGGAAKGFMVRDGAFDDVDIAITWHPDFFSGVIEALSLANMRIDFTFSGRAAHAAATPHLGRSALDAVELMNVGVNYMREHMPSDARIHYAYLDAGGIAPNVVQAKAKVRYLIRAASVVELRPLVARVRKIADGAALMTETQVEAEVISAVCDLLGNTPLETAMQRNLDRIGPPVFTEQDRAFAQAIQDTLTDADVAAAYRRHGLQAQRGKPLHDAVVAQAEKSVAMVGSTDVGDVSQKVPTVQARGATWAVGTPFHSWQAVAQGKSPAAHAAMAHVAKVMAGTALDALRDPALIAAAKEDLRRRMGGRPYESPLPKEAKPVLTMSTAV